jgi:glycosidase
MARIEDQLPLELSRLDLRPRGPVHPSPVDWRDQTLYFLLPDRFSDGGEASRPLYNPAEPDRYRTPDQRAWMDAGKRFQGGTLRGITSKLDYLKDLGVTALWIGPIWRQRPDLQTYHGYGIQNFLDVDPRFGTRRDLRDLVDAAHQRGLYVLLDIIYNHTGNNWFYDRDGQPWNTVPYRYEPRYDVHSWRGADGKPTRELHSVDDGVWPREFQNLDWYTRAGQIQRWDAASWEDPLHPDVEFRRGDFFDLKDLDLERGDVLSAICKVYQYWIALSDCDGFRIDTVKHIPWNASQEFCSQIHEYAESIGKDNFWLLGEVTGGEFMAKSYLEVFGRNIDAVLDIGEPRRLLTDMVKGFSPPAAFFELFSPHDVLGSHRDTGRYHVSILDDHDMVGGSKRRFAAGSQIAARDEQVAHAVGTMLTTLGVPCIYYGTEQAFDGSQDRHDYGIEPHLSFEDRYVREAMFGATFGAFNTSGCHMFNPDHPTYRRIRAITRVRDRRDNIGLALRRGRQFLREIATEGDFRLPTGGEVVGWSRLMFQQDVLTALNTNGAESRSAYITVDHTLHAPGDRMVFMYRSDWTDAQLARPPRYETLTVEERDGRAAVKVTLPPAGMAILA